MHGFRRHPHLSFARSALHLPPTSLHFAPSGVTEPLHPSIPPYLTLALSHSLLPVLAFQRRLAVAPQALDAWSKLNGTLRMKRGALGAAAINGTLVAAGGFWDGARPRPNPNPTDGGPVADVEVYDPRADTWSVAPPLRGPRTSASAAVTGGTMYVVGGENGEGNTVATMEAVALA